MSAKKFIKYAVYIGVIAVLLGVGYSACNTVKSQSIQDSLYSDINLEASLWAEDDRCYQNILRADTNVRLRWNALYVGGFMDLKWWGACDAKIPGSPLNAEAAKVVERKHGLNAGIDVGIIYGALDGLILGGTVRRRAVHHVWRNKNRHPWFPGGWKRGIRGCEGKAIKNYPAGEGCPSIGYYDGVGGYVQYKNYNLDVVITTPQYRWKIDNYEKGFGLTLPFPAWTMDAEYRHDNWAVHVVGETGGERQTTYDIELERRLFTERFWVGASYGRLPVPGWLDPIERLSLSFHIRY